MRAVKLIELWCWFKERAGEVMSLNQTPQNLSVTKTSIVLTNRCKQKVYYCNEKFFHAVKQSKSFILYYSLFNISIVILKI